MCNFAIKYSQTVVNDACLARIPERRVEVHNIHIKSIDYCFAFT